MSWITKSSNRLENILSQTAGLLIGTVVPAGDHQGGAADLLVHLVQVLLGGLHGGADEGLQADTGEELLVRGQPGGDIGTPAGPHHPHGLHTHGVPEVRPELLHPEVPDGLPVSDLGEPVVLVLTLLYLVTGQLSLTTQREMLGGQCNVLSSVSLIGEEC